MFFQDEKVSDMYLDLLMFSDHGVYHYTNCTQVSLNVFFQDANVSDMYLDLLMFSDHGFKERISQPTLSSLFVFIQMPKNALLLF